MGTQKQKIERLVDSIIESESLKFQSIIIQSTVSYESASNHKNIEFIGLISSCEMNKLISRASLVISHGGTGSIIAALEQCKKVIAIPRLSKYGEHVDDHQLELVDAFANAEYVIKFGENDTVDKLVHLAETFEPKKYISNTGNFVRKMTESLEIIIKNGGFDD